MRTYKIKLGFSNRNFCNNNYELFREYFQELQGVYIKEDEIFEMSDRTIYLKYKYNSPIKEIRRIVNKYKKLKHGTRK